MMVPFSLILNTLWHLVTIWCTEYRHARESLCIYVVVKSTCRRDCHDLGYEHNRSSTLISLLIQVLAEKSARRSRPSRWTSSLSSSSSSALEGFHFPLLSSDQFCLFRGGLVPVCFSFFFSFLRPRKKRKMDIKTELEKITNRGTIRDEASKAPTSPSAKLPIEPKVMKPSILERVDLLPAVVTLIVAAVKAFVTGVFRGEARKARTLHLHVAYAFLRQATRRLSVLQMQ